MKQNPFQFGKIVANPTPDAWAQAYNAGNLAAVVSLTQKAIDNREEKTEQTLSLSVLGKDLLNTLEAEYFTLETKNLTTIKQALLTTCEKVGDDITLSFCISVIIENILYVFIYGSGKILLKRQDKLGTLLQQDEDNHLVAASGFIQNDDIVILETKAFANIVTLETLLPCLKSNKINDIAEILSPVIHEHQDGASAALAFSYNEESTPVITEKAIPSETDEQQAEVQEKAPSPIEPVSDTKEESFETEPYFVPKRSFLSHSRRIFLSIGIIILVVLVGSAFFFLKRQQQNNNQQLFQTLVVPAQKKYDEGQGLLDLNKDVAVQDFQQAQQLVKQAESKLPKDSSEYQQATDLDNKISTSLQSASQVSLNNAKQVDTSSDTFLAIISKHSDASAFTQSTTTVYVITIDGITSIDKSTNKETPIISNKGDWQQAGGLDTYLGNFYVLDTKGGIIKYVSSGSSYAKSDYFASGVSPDLSKATSISIDGSIWILTTDGTITKYTKGKQDSLTLKGLDKPLKNPTQILTSIDLNNVYVLDNGNSRVVVFDKNGNYVNQYQSSIIQHGRALDVSEKDKKMYILSNNSLYEIDLK